MVIYQLSLLHTLYQNLLALTFVLLKYHWLFFVIVIPNFCHKKLIVFVNFSFTDKNSALFIFQCTIIFDCLSAFSRCPLSWQLIYYITSVLVCQAFFQNFFKKNFRAFLSLNRPQQTTYLFYYIPPSLSILFFDFFCFCYFITTGCPVFIPLYAIFDN